MRTYLALGIAIVWAISYLGAIATSNYTGFEVSTPVMLIAAAYLLGTQHNDGNGRRHGP